MIEAADIQALVKTAFGSLRGAAYVLLRVGDAAAARAWLRDHPPTSIADGRVERALQVALTAPGLAALGVAPEILAGFSPEFRSGAAEPSRARRLGDTGDSAPAAWDWGAGDREPHVLVMLFFERAVFADRLAELAAETAAGFTTLAVLDTGDMGGREPFGFMDGISQPTLDWDDTAPLGPPTYANRLALGEVLLGHRNEYGLLTDRALVAGDAPGAAVLAEAADAPGQRDLGRNGSYLVLRRLAQDVRGFWRWVGDNGGLPLAEAMTGRKIDGDPLDRLGTTAIDGEADARNRFTYDHDRDGHVLPRGGHIRRANPRTSDAPGAPEGIVQRLASTLGFRGSVADDAIAASRFHRLLRRGREYGTWLAPVDAAKPDAPDPTSGLNFICLQASFARQFEFVQGAWLNSAKFGGLSDEQDPLIGSRDDHPPGCPAAAFTRARPDAPAERLEGLPRFVRVEGAAYFFLPSLRALRFIAAR